MFNVVNDYVKKNGGTCEIVEDKELNNLVDFSIKEYTNTSATIVISTDSNYDIMYGEDYYIEKFNYSTNEWESIRNQCNNCAFTSIGYTVSKKPREFKINWKNMYGELPKGQYRIVKNVFFTSDTPIDDNKLYYIWTEFSI